MPQLTKLTSLMVAGLISLNANALQVMDGVEGKTLFVKVSTRDLNRISIEGGKVRLVKAADDSMIMGSADSDTGQALIKPLVKDTFGIFVFSQSGKTYSLVLEPQDIPGESIIIREPLINKGIKSDNNIDKATSFESQIKFMMQAMASELVPVGIEEIRTWKEIRLWRGSNFALERTLRTQFWQGEQYKLINNSNETMVLTEQEFYVQGVMAVAVTKLSLEPGESSLVYLVKRNEGVK